MRRMLLIILSLLFSSDISLGQNQDWTEDIQRTIEQAEIEWKNGVEDASIKRYLQLIHDHPNLPKSIQRTVYGNLYSHLYDIGEFNEALVYCKKWLPLFPDNGTDISRGTTRLAKCYLACQKYDSAAHYFKQGLHFFSTNSKKYRGIRRMHLMTMNNIGIAYYRNNQPDSALHYYRMALSQDSVRELFPGLYGLVHGNIGQIYFDTEEYEQALDMFLVDIELNEYKILASYQNALLTAAECYMHLNQYSEAESSMQKFFSIQNREIGITIKAHKLMAVIEQKLMHFESANKYLEGYVHLNDSISLLKQSRTNISEQLSNYRFDLIKRDLELARKKQELLEEKELTKSYRLKIWITSTGFGIIVMIVFFYFYRQSQKRKRSLQEVQNQLLKSELMHKGKDLTHFSTSLSYNRKFIDDVLSRLKLLKSKSKNELSSGISELIRELNNYSCVDKSLASLQARVDKVNSEFFEKLSSTYPELTKTEKEICGFLALNLSTKDIAQLRSVTPNAVKKARQNIRKKLPIQPSEDLSEFLSKLN